MKSIKFKILALSLALLLLSIAMIGTISIFGTYNSTMYALEESMMSTIDAAADMVEIQLTAYEDMATQLATDPVLTQEIPAEGEETSDGRTRTQVIDEILAYMDTVKSVHGYDAIQRFDANGMALSIENDSSDVPFFTVPRDTGETYMSDPFVSPESGLLTMPVTAPIIKNGEFDGIILFAVNPTVFSEIVSKVAVGEGSTTTIIDSNGNTIAYNDVQYVMDAYNLTQEAQSDPSLQALANVEQDLMNGGEGFSSVEWDGVSQFTAYTAVDGSNGWGIYVLTRQDTFLAQMITSIVTIGIISVVILIVSAIIITLVASSIAKPISLCAARLNKVAEGDLNSPMPTIRTNDETRVLADSTASIVDSISVMIKDLNYTLSEIAAGNFAVESQAKEYYIGDFSSLKDSLEIIVAKLSSTMYKISNVSDQVNSGNQQVASGAQALAQGAMEQASAIEELSATIAEISDKISETAEASQTAKTANDKSQQALAKSNDQMQEMVVAMGNISEKSDEISKIIKTIDDIAFQTNILSLNAAVEAARAGLAGKGFAVVADEVRELATKSAQSAKDTAVLIEETVGVVEVGNQLASNTSQSINAAIENASELSGLVDSIAAASASQKEGAEQVRIGIEQISAVVQINSATSEESAATSEELSSHSNELQNLVSGFTLSESPNQPPALMP